MPKIIPNIREQLLREAKRQLMEQGYGRTTIRSVANACNLGIGTVYNYFKSKDRLIATFMAEDWKACLVHAKNQTSNNPEIILKSIYDALIDFISKYQPLFCDSDAQKVFATGLAEKHKQLRDQLAKLIIPVCKESSISDKEFLSEYIAESLLTWTVAGIAFEKQYAIVCKIIK